jgi:hypothetical protein
MIPIRLATKDGGEVVEVTLPPFQKMPEVVAWGSRVFAMHGSISIDGDPCKFEYREVFCYVVPPPVSHTPVSG